ncbi:hypothetical protein PHJA_000262800 [Phtheirospermum japonicum]|uniref:S-protein homolog n=1 Tax=Phtheirospermum japonicum TaxID=374723 RepID=A0A830BB06_9LAMI|nr:hypothetical protein PHJA_000262800 [Phtheirospermum japonicum]
MSRLTIHCASGDDELGYHTLSVNEQFHWTFCALPHTLYFCHLWWEHKQKAFVVFKTKIFYDDYNYWSARKDGIYLSQDNKTFTKQFDWESY